jgi:tRNA C32,U32 (ribose-2'-O)-methylase TrmJ
MAYESWLARGGESAPLKPPRKDTPPATTAQLEELFGDWRRALWAVEFFKTRRPESVMRSFREIVHRAGLDGREASLVRAMGIEVVRYLARMGVPIAEPPLADPS